MGNFGKSYNRETMAKRERIPALPDGDYVVKVLQDTDVKETSKGGEQLVMVWEVQGGQFSGRKIFERINLRVGGERTEKTATAERIGEETLNEVLDALGLDGVSRSEQLVGKACTLRLVRKKSTSTYGDENGMENEVKAHKPLDGAAPPASAPAPSAAPRAATPAPSGAPVWAPPGAQK